MLVGNWDSSEIYIGKARLQFDALLQPIVRNCDSTDAIHKSFQEARPYPHLEIDGLFNDALLDLVVEEFDFLPRWREVRTPREHVYRSVSNEDFGPWMRVYMALVNSPEFVRFLSQVSGIANLIADTEARGGGPHETRLGGFFNVHRDFVYHKGTGLKNAMVVITYLNRDWRPDYGGQLEFWSPRGRVASTEPVFGRTIIIRHPWRHPHGCPTPLAPPPGRHRRSIVSYYYVNPHVHRTTVRTSTFLENPKLNERLRMFARGATPPAIWSLGDTLRRRLRPGRR